MKFNIANVMNSGVVAYVPILKDDGRLFTMVVRTDRLLEVEMSPTILMDAVLRYYGSSLRGAKEGTRALLGDIFMQPVVVSEKQGLYWFPGMSTTHIDCVWFALHHVQNHTTIDKNRIAIQLTNVGITIKSSWLSFNRKVMMASLLRCKIEGRPIYRVSETQVRYQILKEIEERNYRIDEFKD